MQHTNYTHEDAMAAIHEVLRRNSWSDREIVTVTKDADANEGVYQTWNVVLMRKERPTRQFSTHVLVMADEWEPGQRALLTPRGEVSPFCIKGNYDLNIGDLPIAVQYILDPYLGAEL